MTRIDHIFHAFSVKQIQFLAELARKRNSDMNNLVAMTTDEKYALELLEMAEQKLCLKKGS